MRLDDFPTLREDTDDRDDRVEWGITSRREPRWPATLAVLVAIVLQLVLPRHVALYLGPRWMIPALEGVLAVALLIANPWHRLESRNLRPFSVGLIILINAANLVALGGLVSDLLNGTNAGGRSLVYASVPIWLTNVIVFGLWYWELDRGGPADQHSSRPNIWLRTFSFPSRPRPEWLRDGPLPSSTTSIPRSPTPRRSARRTPCRSLRGRSC